MTNIHVIQTDKLNEGYILGKCIKELSDVKVGQFVKTYHLMFDKEFFQPHNIYITDDEKIKEGDWFIHYSHEITTLLKAFNVRSRIRDNQGTSYNIDYCKKIILTTDQDLIKDGVQAIDDEFIDWFVNNSNCEKVEVIYGLYNPMGRKVSSEKVSENHSKCIWKYKIILPKEETEESIDTEFQEDLIIEVRKKDLVALYDFAYKLAKKISNKKVNKLKEIDLQFNSKDVLTRLMGTNETPKQEYEYIGECNGNNGNGCFMDSSGHDCGCFIKKPKQDKIMERFIANAKQQGTLEEKLAKIVSKEPSKFWVESDERARIREEQKQHLINIMKSDEELGMYEETAEEYFLSCIKNMLQYNNDALAIRFMEKYYHAKKEQDKESYNDEQVEKLLIACKDRFGGLEDYTHDDVVKEWFNKIKCK
jgi:hypothetical protein